MRTFTIRSLALTIGTAALLIIPAISPAKAAPNDGRELSKKKNQKDADIGERKPAKPTWPPPMDEDFDRKSASGGSGM